MERRAGRYRAHLLVQATQHQELHRFLDRWAVLLWTERVDRQVRWSLDIDPVELHRTSAATPLPWRPILSNLARQPTLIGRK